MHWSLLWFEIHFFQHSRSTSRLHNWSFISRRIVLRYFVTSRKTLTWLAVKKKETKETSSNSTVEDIWQIIVVAKYETTGQRSIITALTNKWWCLWQATVSLGGIQVALKSMAMRNVYYFLVAGVSPDKKGFILSHVRCVLMPCWMNTWICTVL